MRGVLVTMKREIAQEARGSEARLIDDAHRIWVAAATDCARALRSWFRSTSRNSTDAYWNYRAALDREEAAAHDLELLETVSPDAVRPGPSETQSSPTP
jgi:hypothetical protein